MSMDNDSRLFTNARILTAQGVFETGSLLVRHGIIESIRFSLEEWNEVLFSDVIDVKGRYLVPGFIDVHVHGGGGVDVMSGLPAELEQLSRFEASHGVTSFLATTLTAERDKLEHAVAGIATAMKNGTSGAEIIG